jgi:hypothetical protein
MAGFVAGSGVIFPHELLRYPRLSQDAKPFASAVNFSDCLNAQSHNTTFGDFLNLHNIG